MKEFKNLKIAVAGTGYVGLSLAVLLAQHHQVTAVDIVPEKVELINSKKSPIQDEYIEKYLAEKELKRVNRPEACGLRHLAFRVENVEATVEELAQMGIECEPIRLDSYTKKKMTFFFDPDGLPLELHE